MRGITIEVSGTLSFVELKSALAALSRHFRTHIPKRNLLTKVAFDCLYISDIILKHPVWFKPAENLVSLYLLILSLAEVKIFNCELFHRKQIEKKI